MIINRVWEMPNSKTFKINAIKELILKYVKENDLVLDPFANESSIKEHLPKCEYISNDLDTQYNTDYHEEAQDFLARFQDNSVDVVLYDPPYSGRQVSECYKALNKTVTMSDTNSGYFVKFKEQIARILKPNGIVITCGWNTNGIGKKYNMDLIEVLDIAHGSAHYDTLVTVEQKVIKKKTRLFATKEEAEWELEFGDITRTETLKLPNFVKVENDDWLEIDFTNKYKEICEIIIENGIILIYNKIRVKTYFRRELTEENYIEACKLCLRLFKGEEI